jgi:hypothetical protein
MPYQALILIDPQAGSPSKMSAPTKAWYLCKETHRHRNAAQAHVWAQSLADTRSSPECSKRSVRLVRSRLPLSFSPLLYLGHHVPILVSVEERREDSMQVCACANEEENDEKERLELEDAELDD